MLDLVVDLLIGMEPATYVNVNPYFALGFLVAVLALLAVVAYEDFRR